PQTLGDIAVGDPACQPFDDGGLADTRFSYQDRVVLRTSGQDLDDAANLVIPADHRVELALAGLIGQISTVLLQGIERRLGVLRCDPPAATYLHQRFPNPIDRQAVGSE